MDNGNTFVTRKELETFILPQLEIINAKLDAISISLGDKITRAEYDHHRDSCNDSVKRLHDRLEFKEREIHTYVTECTKGRVHWAVTVIVSLMASAMVGIGVALVLKAVGA